MSELHYPEPQYSTKTNPELLARMLRAGNRYSPRRFAVVEAVPPSDCQRCGTEMPLDGDVLITGLAKHNGKIVLLDEYHEEFGTYPSVAEALESFAETEECEPENLEILWLDETGDRDRTPAATSSPSPA